MACLQVSVLLRHAAELAAEALAANSSLLHEMVVVLEDHEVLEGEQLNSFLQRAQAPASLGSWLDTGSVDTS